MTDNEMLGRLLTVDFIDEHGNPLNEFRKAVINRLAMHFWLEMELRQLARKYAAMSRVNITTYRDGEQ